MKKEKSPHERLAANVCKTHKKITPRRAVKLKQDAATRIERRKTRFI